MNTSLLIVTDLFKQQSLSKVNLKKRIGQLPIGRFVRFPHGTSATKINSDIKISVNKNVFLCGYGVYGRKTEALEKYGKAVVTISLQNETESINLAATSKTINCDGTDKIYDIFLKTRFFLNSLKFIILM